MRLVFNNSISNTKFIAPLKDNNPLKLTVKFKTCFESFSTYRQISGNWFWVENDPIIPKGLKTPKTGSTPDPPWRKQMVSCQYILAPSMLFPSIAFNEPKTDQILRILLYHNGRVETLRAKINGNSFGSSQFICVLVNLFVS